MSSSSEELVVRLPDAWRTHLMECGERPFRANQIFRWIHQRGTFDPEGMSDISASLRARLKADGLAAPGKVVDVHRSLDGTRKLLIEFREQAKIECVLIPMSRPSLEDGTARADDSDGEDDEDAPGASEPPTRERVTLCISTQFGCAMGCVFCASGQAGLTRGLSAAEIVSQVYLAQRYLAPREYLRNLVFMGMGEPLHHYDSTVHAVRLLTHPEGLGLGLRRITVSTVGLVPGIERLGQDFSGKIGLAVSVHAPNDAIRDQIVPMNRRYPLSDLLRALRAYPLPRRRRITIEYTLIDHVNDEPAHARELADLFRGLPVKMNLIPVNAVQNAPYACPSRERVLAFQEQLVGSGYSCFIRARRGDEVAAACGQLAMQGELVASSRLRRRFGRSSSA